MGLTVQRSKVAENANAGIRYNPIISARLQKDVVSCIVRDITLLVQFNGVTYVWGFCSQHPIAF